MFQNLLKHIIEKKGLGMGIISLDVLFVKNSCMVLALWEIDSILF